MEKRTLRITTAYKKVKNNKTNRKPKDNILWLSMEIKLMKKFRNLLIVALIIVAVLGVFFVSSSAAEESLWIDPSDMPELEEYAYSFAVLGDIQTLTYYDLGSNDIDTNYPIPMRSRLQGLYNWIVDNKDSQNIKFCIGLGDITEKNLIKEYKYVANQYDKLVDNKIPFSITRGNHDKAGEYSEANTSRFDSYITADRFGGFDGWSVVSYDNTMKDTYSIITIGEYKYLFLSLDYTFTADALAWADEVIKNNQDCRVIVSTHIYGSTSGFFYDVGEGTDLSRYGAENNGETLWNNVLKKYKNVYMILNGHSSSDDIFFKKRLGDNGNRVAEFLIDPQQTDKDHDYAGLIAMFYFNAEGTKLQVRYYSPNKNQYFKATNQFTLNLDIPQDDYSQEKNVISTDSTYGDLVFVEEFNDSSKTTEYLAKAFGKNRPFLAPSDTKYFKIEDGKLKVNLPNANAIETFRFPLYSIDYDAYEFTVQMIYKTKKVYSDGAGNAVGPVIADNLIENYKNDDQTGTFQMFWSRVFESNPTTSSQTGIQSYGNLKSQSRNDNTKGYVANQYHILTITVNLLDNQGVYTLAQYDNSAKTVGTVLAENVSFAYETGSSADANVNPVIGLLFNAVESEVESVKVYIRDDETPVQLQYSGANMLIGDSLAIKYSADLSGVNVDYIDSLKTKFTMNGKSVYVDAVINENTATFLYDGISPQCIGDEITAELYANGNLVYTKKYSVKEYLDYVASHGTAKEIAVAKEALVYGAAAQKYKNYKTDALVTSSNPATPYNGDRLAFVTNGTSDKVSIVSAGAYFDYVNKIFFKFEADDINSVAVTINGVPAMIDPNFEIVGGKKIYKVYTEAIYASELLSKEFTIKITAGGDQISATYSVLTYISRKYQSNSAIADLVNSLYSYGKATLKYIGVDNSFDGEDDIPTYINS